MRTSFIRSITESFICFMIGLSLLNVQKILWLPSSFDGILLLPVLLCYIHFLYRPFERKRGKVLSLVILIFFSLIPILIPSVSLICCVSMCLLVWLTRVNLCYVRHRSRFFDVLIVLFGLMWSEWVYLQSHSLGLSLWTFLFSQSLCVFIMDKHVIIKKDSLKASIIKFDNALKKAEVSLGKLTYF